MKKFDEVNDILVDFSWRFTTVIIIDIAVFIAICSCLFLAIRSYNKNAKVALERDLQINKRINIRVLSTGLKRNCILQKNQYIDPLVLESAIANKDIIIREEIIDFDHIPNFNRDEYTRIYTGYGFAIQRYFCIRWSFYNHIGQLIKEI